MIALAAYLILGHLIGDFVFQPSKLVIWKNKSKLGLAAHILVHFIFTLLLLSPYLFFGNHWLIFPVIAICVTHFFIDHFKITYDSDKKHKNKLKPFLLDQLMHFGIIILTLIIAYAFNKEPHIPTNGSIYYLAELPIYFSTVILATNALEIYNYEKDLTKKRKHQVRFITEQSISRFAVITLLFFLYLLARY